MTAGTAIMIGVGLLALGGVGYVAMKPSAVPAAPQAIVVSTPGTKGGNTDPGYGAGTGSGVWDFLTGLVSTSGGIASKAVNSGGGEKGNSGYGGSGALKAGSGNDGSFSDFWTNAF